LAVQLDYPQVV